MLSRCHVVALSRCHVVALSHCHDVALSRCHVVALSRCHVAALSQYSWEMVESVRGGAVAAILLITKYFLWSWWGLIYGSSVRPGAFHHWTGRGGRAKLRPCGNIHFLNINNEEFSGHFLRGFLSFFNSSILTSSTRHFCNCYNSST